MRSARQSTRENEKPADQRAFVKLQHFRGNLERAKGLEPSTPTLARSCSTTELHPHPRWRRSLAGNGRAMPNADRECNSPHTAWNHRNNPISLTIGRKSVRNDAQSAVYRGRDTSAVRKTAQAAIVSRSNSSHFSNEPCKGSGQFVAPGGFAIERRPPFDERPVAIGNWRDPQGGLIIGHRHASARRRIRRFATARRRIAPAAAAGFAAPDRAHS